MDDEQKLQSEIDLISGDETGTSTRGATTGTDEDKGSSSGASEDGGSGKDDGNSGSLSGTCYISVTANPSAGASTIYVKKSSDTGTGSTQLQLVSGTEYTLYTIASSGYSFTGWYLDNVLQSSNTTFNYTETSSKLSNKEFEARFALNSGSSSTLTISIDPSGSGRVTGAGTYTNSTEVTVTATPNSGYSFKGWYESTGTAAAAGKAVSFSSTYTFVLKKNTTLIAKFSEGQATSWISQNNTQYDIYTYMSIPNSLAESFEMNGMTFNGSKITSFSLVNTEQGRTTTILSYMFTYDFGEYVDLEQINYDFDYYIELNGTTVHNGMTSIVATQQFEK